MLKSLSPSLEQEIQIHLYSEFLKSIPIFRKHYSRELLNDLTKKIYECRVASNSNIIETGNFGGFGLYLVTSGEAEILIQLNNKKY
jgi:hypothetical protein